MKYKFFKNVKTVEELKKQYKKLAFIHHPDKGGKIEDMQQVNNEYDTLYKKIGNIHESENGNTYTTENDTGEKDKFKDIINSIINFNVDIELCGNWLWIFNGYIYREQLKNLGFFYCSNKKAWAWTDTPKKSKHKMTLEEIRERYGSEKIKVSEKMKILKAN